MSKFKVFINTFEVEIVKFFKKYKARQDPFKHKPRSSYKMNLLE